MPLSPFATCLPLPLTTYRQPSLIPPTLLLVPQQLALCPLVGIDSSSLRGVSSPGQGPCCGPPVAPVPGTGWVLSS